MWPRESCQKNIMIPNGISTISSIRAWPQKVSGNKAGGTKHVVEYITLFYPTPAMFKGGCKFGGRGRLARLVLFAKCKFAAIPKKECFRRCCPWRRFFFNWPESKKTPWGLNSQCEKAKSISCLLAANFGSLTLGHRLLMRYVLISQ